MNTYETIALKPGIKERLVKRAHYGDSMSDVVEELLDIADDKSKSKK
jgi:hypothetical protein